jgi:hypothetical protein
LTVLLRRCAPVMIFTRETYRRLMISRLTTGIRSQLFQSTVHHWSGRSWVRFFGSAINQKLDINLIQRVTLVDKKYESLNLDISEVSMNIADSWPTGETNMGIPQDLFVGKQIVKRRMPKNCQFFEFLSGVVEAPRSPQTESVEPKQSDQQATENFLGGSKVNEEKQTYVSQFLSK